MATRREKICSLLLGYLQNISTANGYNTTPDSVTHWKSLIIPKDKTIILNMKDRINDYTDADGRKELLEIEVEIACKTSTNHITISGLIQDIQKAFYSNIQAIGTAIGENGCYWVPLEEELNIEIPETESEVGSGSVLMLLAHRFYDIWQPDLTDY